MKKKILLASIIALSLALLVAVGGTVAWLFASTEDLVNTFTPSNVAVELKENTGEFYKMIPGTVLPKDPTVTVKNDIDCYVFIELEKVNNPDKYLEYSIDTSVWTQLTGYENVYYCVLTPEQSETPLNVLTGKIVTVKDSVTKTDMDALYDASGAVIANSQPQLKFTAHVIQKDHTGSPAEAWAKLNSPTNP